MLYTQVGDWDALTLYAYGVPWDKIKQLGFDGGRKAVKYYEEQELQGKVKGYTYPPVGINAPPSSSTRDHVDLSGTTSEGLSGSPNTPAPAPSSMKRTSATSGTRGAKKAHYE